LPGFVLVGVVVVVDVEVDVLVDVDVEVLVLVVVGVVVVVVLVVVVDVLVVVGVVVVVVEVLVELVVYTSARAEPGSAEVEYPRAPIPTNTPNMASVAIATPNRRLKPSLLAALRSPSIANCVQYVKRPDPSCRRGSGSKRLVL
jgi:hypothetical protein